MDFAKDFGKHEFLSAYLSYVQNTESPKLAHVWCALSGVSACLGRRCWYDTGIGQVWPNMYVVISGPPGGRKSSAIRYVGDLLRKVTTIRFAPDDTGGQRQGLIKAMTDVGEEEASNEDIADIISEVTELAKTETFVGLGAQSKSKGILERLENIHFDTRDPHSMFVFASELKSFIGENNSQMLTFLLKMWDGDDYKYELRNSTYEIKDGLLGILGATTPSELATMLPAGAMGSGFTSRIIFVYAPGRNQRIPRPTLDASARQFLETTFASLFDRFSGGFTETAAAARAYDDIYNRGCAIDDPRFTHYSERRHTHLQKLALSVAASRGAQTIAREDILLADQLLLMTERAMPDALGEYGMNKDSVAKQRLLDFVSGLVDAMPTPLVYSMMSRDMTRAQFENALTELHNGKKLTVLNMPDKGQCVIGVSNQSAKRATREMDQIYQLLTQTGTKQ